MRRYMIAVMGLLLALALACGGQDAAPTATPAATPAATIVPTATHTAVPAATNTALPTDTPAPSPTPPPTETPTPDPAADFISYNDEARGIRLGYSADWLTDSIDDGDETILVFATSEDWLDSISDGPGALLGLLVRPRATYDEMTGSEILASVVEEFPLADEPEEVEGTADLSVNDLPAFATVQQGITDMGSDMTALYVVVYNDTQVVVLLGAATTPEFESYRPVLEAMIHRLEIGPAGTGETNGSLVAYVPYGSPNGRFSLVYPEGWQIEEEVFEDGVGVVMASDAALMDNLDEGESGATFRVGTVPLADLNMADPSADTLTNLTAYLTSIGMNEANFLEPAQLVWYNGLAMAQADLVGVGETEARAIIVWAETEDTALVVFAVATPDAVESQLPILQTMAGSLLFGTAPAEFATWDEGEGLTFRYPAEWVFDQDSSYVILTSSQALLDSNSPAEVDEGGGIQFEQVQNALTADPLEALAADLPSFLDNFAGGTAEIEEVQGIHLVALNGQLAAMTTYQATLDGVSLLLNRVAITNGTSSLLFATIVLEDSAATYQPILNSIANSVTLED